MSLFLPASRRALLASTSGYPSLTALVPTPAIWTAADRVTGVAPGGALAQWNDLSGNARHFSGGVSPTYQINAVNGMPAVRFNGSTQYLQSPSFTHNTTATVIVVARQNTGNVGIANADTITGGRHWQLRAASSLWFDTLGGLVVASVAGMTITAANILTGIRRTAGACRHYRGAGSGGPVVTNVTTPNSGASEVQIGRDFGGGGADFLSGDIAEFIYYTRALSDPELAVIWAYLAWKYHL